MKAIFLVVSLLLALISFPMSPQRVIPDVLGILTMTYNRSIESNIIITSSNSMLSIPVSDSDSKFIKVVFATAIEPDQDWYVYVLSLDRKSVDGLVNCEPRMAEDFLGVLDKYVADLGYEPRQVSLPTFEYFGPPYPILTHHGTKVVTMTSPDLPIYFSHVISNYDGWLRDYTLVSSASNSDVLIMRLFSNLRRGVEVQIKLPTCLRVDDVLYASKGRLTLSSVTAASSERSAILR